MSRTQKLLYVLTAVAILAAACNRKSKEEIEEELPEYDRSAMLANIADNLILPSYAALKASCDSLAIASNVFVQNQDVSALSSLKSAHLNAWKAWQMCSVYELGPAANVTLRAAVNTFPADTTQILGNVTSGSYDLASAANLDAKGFPGIEYLLYPPGYDSSQVAALFAANPNRRQYLSDLVSELYSLVTSVHNQWIPSGGNYTATFKASTGTDVGSSTGMLVNQINYDYEILKGPKVGIPLGKFTLGTPYPQNVEAYYSGNSALLANLQLVNLESVFLGRTSSGANGTGIDDYLDYIAAGSLAVKTVAAASVEKPTAIQRQRRDKAGMRMEKTGGYKEAGGRY